MGISRFSVDFERDLYHPGQVVSGRVCLTLDKPKEIRGNKFILILKQSVFYYLRHIQFQSVT